MIKIDRSILDCKGWKKISKSILKDLQKHLKFDFDISFEEIICEEGDSSVVISATSEHYNDVLNFIYDFDNKPAEKIKEKYSHYGDFNFRVEKIIKDDVNDVDIGDIVAIEHDYSDEISVGIVASVSYVDGEKIFGCSHVVVKIRGSILSSGSESAIELTDTNYGIHYKGFAKKLTLEEAKDIIDKKIEEEREEIKKSIDDDCVYMKKNLEVLLKGITGDKKIYSSVESKILRFKEDDLYFHGVNISDKLKGN